MRSMLRHLKNNDILGILIDQIVLINFTRIVEDTVRKYPDQWLWVHQRWKTTLKKDEAQYASMTFQGECSR
jgi:lauroyl/myristoyl acyltransferase